MGNAHTKTLVPLPAGWHALTWEQLVNVWQIYAHVRGDRVRYHIEVFCYLTGLPPIRLWRFDGDGLVVKDRGATWLITLPALEYYAFGQLAWLDEPHGLPAPPREFVKVGRTRYKLPAANLLNFTWQQYNNVQRIMVALWNKETRLDKLLQTQLPSDETAAAKMVADIKEKVDAVERDILDLRAQFLAHALLPPALALTDTKDRATRFRPHRVYQYDVGMAKEHAKRLRKAPPWLFSIVYQVVQSSLSFYAKQFPDLFKSSGAGYKKRNELIAEVGTINAVMKYNGYHDQQDVYDSNAVFIFEILYTMTKEAAEAKKVMPTKKR